MVTQYHWQYSMYSLITLLDTSLDSDCTGGGCSAEDGEGDADRQSYWTEGIEILYDTFVVKRLVTPRTEWYIFALTHAD